MSSLIFDDMSSTTISSAASATNFLQQKLQHHQQQMLTAAASTSSTAATTAGAVASKTICTPILSASSSTTTTAAAAGTTFNAELAEVTSLSSSTSTVSDSGVGIMNGNAVSSSLCSSLANSPISSSAVSTTTLSSFPLASSSLTSNAAADNSSITAKTSTSLTLGAANILVQQSVADDGTTLIPASSSQQSLSLTSTSASTMLLASASDTEATPSLPISNISSSASSSSSTAAAVSTTPSSAQLLLNGIVAASNSCVSNLENMHQHQQQQQHLQQQQQALLSEDSRTLQLALELSMVGLNDVTAGGGVVSPAAVAAAPLTTTITMQHLQNLQSLHQHQQHQQQQHQQQQLQQQHLHHHHHQQQLHASQQSTAAQQQQQLDFSTLSAISAAVAAAAAAASANNVHNNHHHHQHQHSIGGGVGGGGNSNSSASIQQFSGSGSVGGSVAVSGAFLPPSLEDRSKKSQNMTECVPVPSSEHVAEIVGRQGCKIKALRAKTNTYIKTPVRGEEPVFVVTGRKEDVAKAKREILSAADHFSLIRATRKPSFESSLSSGSGGGGGNSTSGGGGSSCGKTPLGPPSIPGQVTIQVRVPYRVVGLVVGPKGATIKHIQQETQTYIVTPSREKEPIFEVSGLPDNVQAARKQIEAHIALRTGNLTTGGSGAAVGLIESVGVGSRSAVDVTEVHTINSLSQILNEEINPDLLASLYKNGICSTFDYSNGENCSVGSAATVSSGIVSPNSAMNLNLAAVVNGIGGVHATNQLIMAGSTANNSASTHAQHHFEMQNHHQQQQQSSSTTNNDYLNAILITTADVDGGLYNSQQQQLHHVHHSTAHHMGANTTNDIAFNGLNSATTSTMNAINLTTINTGAGANTNIVCPAGHVGGNNHNTIIGMTRSCSSASSTTSSKSATNSGGSTNSSRPELINIWKNLGDSLDVDEGIGDSPSIWTTLPTSLAALTTSSPSSHCSPSASDTSVSPTDSLLGEISAAASLNYNLMPSQHHHVSSSTIGAVGCNNMLMSTAAALQQSSNMSNMNLPGGIRRECLVCNDKEVTAALVPCGHNMFCMECANRICASGDAICPICSLTVYHAMRILA